MKKQSPIHDSQNSVLMPLRFVIMVSILSFHQTATSQLNLIRDINPGTGSSVPVNFTSFDSNLVFTSNYGLWKYDGDSATQIDNNLFSSLAVLGDTLFLYRWHGGIYKYDGTNVYQLYQINSNVSSIAANFEMKTLNSELYTVYQKDFLACEILKYNSTDTMTVTNFNIPMSQLGALPLVNIKSLTAFQGSLYFLFFNGSNTSLYKYTSGIGIQLIAIINPSNNANEFLIMDRSICTVGNTLFLSANLGTAGSELYSYNGDSLALVSDINPGMGSSSPTWLVAYQGQLYFNAYTAAPGPHQYRNKLYQFDPITRIVSVVDFSLPGISSNPNPAELTVFAPHLFFTSLNTSGTGYKLCRHDSSGTTVVTDSDSISSPQHIVTDNRGLYFSANDGIHGVEPWEYRPSGLTEVLDPSPLPSEFFLRQNYPNPFNPNTTIQLSIAHPTHVTLTIFNILGQEIATIVSQDMHSGTHTFEWDAKGFPSGVYFYRLKVDASYQTKNMILTR